MAVLKFPVKTDSEKNIIKNINLMIDDAYEQSENLQEILAGGPALLESLSILSCILRNAKRTGDINSAINLFCFEACPPHRAAEEDPEYCSQNNCEHCWKNYIDTYLEKVIQKDKN